MKNIILIAFRNLTSNNLRSILRKLVARLIFTKARASWLLALDPESFAGQNF